VYCEGDPGKILFYFNRSIKNFKNFLFKHFAIDSQPLIFAIQNQSMAYAEAPVFWGLLAAGVRKYFWRLSFLAKSSRRGP